MNLDQATEDRLRELGAADDMLRWLRNPDSVRALLKHPPADRNGECPGECYGGPYNPHSPDCEIAAAWRALGDPRAVEDITNAHEDALAEEKRFAERRREEAETAATAERIAGMSDTDVVDALKGEESRDSLYEIFDWAERNGFWPAERTARLKENFPDEPAKNPRPMTATEAMLRQENAIQLERVPADRLRQVEALLNDGRITQEQSRQLLAHQLGARVLLVGP